MKLAAEKDPPLLETERLILRGWREEDLPAFARMNNDPNVTEFLKGPMAMDESSEMMARLQAGFAERGFGLWAVEIKAAKRLAGFTGITVPRFEATFTPCFEVGWRLACEHWGKGYATEAAREAIRFGFEQAGLGEIVSFTTVANIRSRRVMEKLGMTRDPAEDFDHPALPAGHPIRPHVLYRLSRRQWLANHIVG
jgi:ribosomal-protein-alanine N-acetyltransferase